MKPPVWCTLVSMCTLISAILEQNTHEVSFKNKLYTRSTLNQKHQIPAPNEHVKWARLMFNTRNEVPGLCFVLPQISVINITGLFKSKERKFCNKNDSSKIPILSNSDS